MLSSLLLLALVRQTPPPSVPPPATDEVPFEIDTNTIVVPATINGRSLRLIFDTGFAGTCIVDSSIDLGKPSGKQSLEDFVGTFDADYYDVKSIKLGDKVVTGNDLQVISQPGASNFGETTHVDGLMGLTAIKDYVTEINFEKHKFIFHPASEDITKRVPNGKTTFLVPMEPVGSRAINLAVTTSTGKKMILALDTGNYFYATTHRDVLERVGLWKAGEEPKFLTQSGVASGAVTSWYKKLDDLTVFGVPVPSSIWDIIDLPAADADSDGTVGFQFLENFNITFDYKRRYVWLENFTGKVSAPPVGSTGISAIWSNEAQAVVVALVSQGTPADQAGIVAGDLILDLDDNDLAHIRPIKLHRMLEGPVGSTLKLDVSHGGISRRVVLTRAALVN